MKVVIVSSLGRESSTFLGRLLPLSKELAKKGVKVKLFLLHYKYRFCVQKRFQEEKGVTSCYLGQAAFFKDERSKQYFPFLKLLFVLKISSLRILWTLLKEKNIDAIIVSKPHPHNFTPAILAAKLKRVKLILDSDDLEYASNKKVTPFQKFILKLTEKVGVKFCDHILACSPFLVEHYKKLGVAEQKITFIPTGIDLSLKKEVLKDKRDIKKEFGLPQDEKIILYLGSLSIASGHRLDILLTAFKKVAERIDNVFLVIGGSGEDYFFLKEKVKSLKINQKVKFLGRFVQENAFPLIKIADVVADPVDRSPTNKAKSSFRLTEAMYFQKPYVSLNSGIQKYFGYGFLVEEETSSAFAGALEKVLLDKGLKEKITSISFEKIKKITFPYLAEKVYEILKAPK